jgi:medium-chain acyl-[acyl-carrier-protein] hydrolase
MTSPWFTRFAPRPAARLRLFCFSYAGGGAVVYRPWALAMPAEIEVAAALLPGRESRLREPPVRSMSDLMSALVPAIEPQLDRPFAFFGHSMGAVVAHELARVLQQRGGPVPQRLLLSGRRAPHLPERDPPMHHLGDDAFVAEIQRRYNGIPAEVLQYPELLELLLPSLRADMSVIETHRLQAAGQAPVPFSGPISVFGGRDDPRATPGELEVWQAHTSEPLVMRQFAGGHFYFNNTETRNALIAAVASDLEPHLSCQAAMARA